MPLKRFNAYSRMDAFLHGSEIWLSKFSLLSIFILNKLTEFVVLIVWLLILRHDWLFSFLFSSNMAWNFYGFTIILFWLNQSTAVSDSFSKVCMRLLMFLDAVEMALSSAKLKSSDIFNVASKSLRNKLKRIGPKIDPCVLQITKLGNRYGNFQFLHFVSYALSKSK